MRTVWDRLSKCVGIVALPKARTRRFGQAFQHVELFESRLLLSAWDTNWQYGPPPNAVPPHQMEINEPGLSLIEVPDEGNVPLQVKTKGDTLKGKAKSGNIKGKVALHGNFADNQTPNDGDTFTGTVNFKIKTPGQGTQRISMQVVGLHAQG